MIIIFKKIETLNESLKLSKKSARGKVGPNLAYLIWTGLDNTLVKWIIVLRKKRKEKRVISKCVKF